MIRLETNKRVAHLVIDVPPVNVLDTAALDELEKAVAECAASDDLSAVLLHGEGKCFSAGASVEEHKPGLAEGMITGLTRACCALAALPVPVVSLVHGSCLGGGLELAIFADYLVADPGATFGVPEIRLAFFPPVAARRLPRLVGYQNAAHLALTGESIPAERAREIGLVQQILPQEEWGDVEKRFNRLSRPVLRLCKEALQTASPAERPEDLAALELLFLTKLYQVGDVAEGIASFEEKRRPEWKHE
jgi:cyclohexa-1,5-dienecarbonyl-CoA hydratase